MKNIRARSGYEHLQISRDHSLRPFAPQTKNRHYLIHSASAPYTSQSALSNFCTFTCTGRTTSRNAGYILSHGILLATLGARVGDFPENLDFCWL